MSVCHASMRARARTASGDQTDDFARGGPFLLPTG
jgi:hypothetical protein